MAGDRRKRRAPSGLGDRGLRLWHEITDLYVLRPDEFRLLEDACRQASIVDRLERELAGASLVMRGSMGQPVANPLLTEVRQHRSALAALFRQLGFPDLVEDSGAVDVSRSVQAREAAKSRWAVAHGHVS